MYRLKMVFGKWAETTDVNREERNKVLTIQNHLTRKSKEQHFFEWVDLTSRMHHGSKVYQKTLKKKVLKAFLKFFENQETKERIISTCQAHLGNLRAKNIIKLWRIQNEEQQKYRNF